MAESVHYLTVLPETSKLAPYIRRAMRDVEKATTITPKYETRGARAAGQQAGRELQRGVQSAARGTSLGSLVRVDGAQAMGSQAGASFSRGFASSSGSVSRSIQSMVGGTASMSAARAGGEQLGTGFGTSFKAALGAVGVAGGITALVGGLRDSVTTGLSFERQMNTLQGVTAATQQQMDQLRATASALGSDTTMAGVGTSDAAAAMVELAKGGLSVEQAMAAARGTLQLATAGQVSGAEAAKTQAAALNIFQLDASKATHVADLLANAANASAADIPDLALALQQGGSAAAGFGLSIDETMTALTMFSKFGINGSDAGTMLKTSLLAITDGGEPAAQAINALGLQLYDANGQFVGYTNMMEQVAAASRRMTEQEFQASTAVLFGSDAMRASMIAANGGAGALDGIAASLQRQGAAAELANAQMTGLPGVVEGLKNTWEGFSLAVFGALDGPMQSVGNFVLDLANGKFPVLVNAFKGVAAAITVFVLPALAGYVAAQVAALAASAAGAIARIAGAWRTVATVLRTTTIAQLALNAAMLLNPVALIVAAVVAAGAAIWAFFAKTETGRALWDKIWTGIKTTVSTVWTWLKSTLSTAWEQIGPSVMRIGEVAKQAFGAFVGAVKTVWTAIQPAIAWIGRLVLAVMKFNFSVAIAALKALGAVIGWLWNNVVVPAFSGIATAAETMWAGAQVVWAALTNAVQWVGDKLMWLWNNVAVPAFTAIAGAAASFWAKVEGIWTLFQAALGVVGDKFNTFRDTISNAFNAVKDVVTGVWDKIKGVIDSIGNGIGTVVDKLRSVPGLGALIPGAATGGVVQAYARGGTVRGPGTGTSDSVLALLSDGEGIVTAAAMRSGGGQLVAALNAGWVPPVGMLREMLPGFAAGTGAGGLNSGASYLRDTVMSRWSNIKTVGGYRSEDGYREHSTGNALDIMIPDYGSEAGVRTGNEVLSFLQANADELQVDGIIWRAQSYGYGRSITSARDAGGRGSDTANHMDHLHVILGSGRGEAAAAIGAPSGGLALGGSAGGAASSLGASTSASGGGGRRAATSKELASSSSRVDSAQRAVVQADQAVDDRTYARDKAQRRLDETRAAGKDTTDAQRALDVANRELADATDKQARATEKAAQAAQDDATLRESGVEDASAASDGGGDFGDLGSSLWGGLLETIGLDGSLFSNPFEWPTVKSLMAGVNVLGGMLSGEGAVGGDGATLDAGGLLGGLLGGSVGAPQPGDLNPGASGVATPHMGSGAAPGPAQGGGAGVDNSINFTGNVGMDPGALTTAWRNEQAARTRTTVTH